MSKKHKTKSAPKAAKTKPTTKHPAKASKSVVEKKLTATGPHDAAVEVVGDATAPDDGAAAVAATDTTEDAVVASSDAPAPDAPSAESDVLKAKPAPTPRARDPRLPPVGTVIEKRDRNGTVRCSCEITESGVVYAGRSYGSLSSAAVAAARDLGLGGKSQNGYVFWCVIPVTRKWRDPMASVVRAWTRYRGQLDALVRSVSDDNRATATALLREHAEAIDAAGKKVA